MRLGKSLSAISWVNHRMVSRGIQRPRILLVAPVTPLLDWERELRSEHQRMVLVRGSARSRVQTIQDGQGWFLIGYQAAIATPELAKAHWDAIILDESTAIKNPQSRTTKFFLRRFNDVQVRAILTGLPVPQSYLEIWAQMAFLNAGSWMGCDNYWSWRRRVAYQAGFKWKIKDEALIKIKRLVHTEGFVLTRNDAGYADRKERIRITGQLCDGVRSLYARCVRDWKIPGVTGSRAETKYAMVVVSWLHRICGGFTPAGQLPCWKYDRLKELLTGDLQQSSVVIWSCYSAEINRLWHLLRGWNVSASWIGGSLSRDSRSKKIARFRSGLSRVLLVQTQCGKYGLDLSRADAAIYLSCSYSYENRRQSEDRIVHVDQSHRLRIYDLVTENTVDEDVQESLDNHNSDAAYFMRRVMNNRRMG